MPESYAIIIGSGFDALASNDALALVETPYGMPSAAIKRVALGATSVLTLARHGEPHVIPPHAINYRANLAALKAAGATHVIALNTVGLVTSIVAPGGIGVPDQILDYTWGRQHTIYDGLDEPVQHIEFTEPFCAELRQGLLDAAERAGVDCFAGGVYAATQGPRLESAAEVDRLERDGADYVGMTGMPEAAIARELGLCYAGIAMGVNKAAGRGDQPIHDDVETHTLAARACTEKLLRHFF